MDKFRRKMSTTETFDLFAEGRFNFGWPKSYNFLTGKVDFEAPEMKKRYERKERLLLAEE